MKKSSIIVSILLVILIAIAILLLQSYPEQHILVEIFVLIALSIILLSFAAYNKCPNCGKMPRFIFQKHCSYCGEKFDKKLSDR